MTIRVSARPHRASSTAATWAGSASPTAIGQDLKWSRVDCRKAAAPDGVLLGVGAVVHHDAGQALAASQASRSTATAPSG